MVHWGCCRGQGVTSRRSNRAMRAMAVACYSAKTCTGVVTRGAGAGGCGGLGGSVCAMRVGC